MNYIYKFRVGVRSLAGLKKLKDNDIIKPVFLIGTSKIR